MPGTALHSLSTSFSDAMQTMDFRKRVSHTMIETMMIHLAQGSRWPNGMLFIWFCRMHDCWFPVEPLGSNAAQLQAFQMPFSFLSGPHFYCCAVCCGCCTVVTPYAPHFWWLKNIEITGGLVANVSIQPTATTPWSVCFRFCVCIFVLCRIRWVATVGSDADVFCVARSSTILNINGERKKCWNF